MSVCECCGLPYATCETCGVRFRPKQPHHVGRFCSSKCVGAAKRTRPTTLLNLFVRRAADDECWLEWLGSVNTEGYPCIRWGNRWQQARRVIYESVYGAIAPGRSVRSRCGSRRCVNPAHLRVMPPLPVSIAEKRRTRRTLTLAALPRLQAWRELRGLSRSQLATLAGVSWSTLWRIEHGVPARPDTASRLAEALGITQRALGSAA